MTKDADDLRSAAVQARELADLLDGYLNSPQQVALGEELRSVLDSALVAAPAPQPIDDQVLRAVMAYVQAGKRGEDLKGAMRCAIEAASPSPQHDGPSAFRDAVLEEAAKKAESDEFYGTVIPVAIAAAIRGMKGQP